MEIWNALLDAVLDTLKTLPFLLAAYLMVEWLEHRASDAMVARMRSAEKYGPLVGALAGCVPQCGFAVLSAKLYNAGAVTLGALLAVFISTSDDALVVMLSSGKAAGALTLLAIKLLLAVAAGFGCDVLVRRAAPSGGVLSPRPHIEPQRHDHSDDNCHCECEGSVWRPALRRTGKTLLFIFAVLLALGLLTAALGEDALSSLLLAGTAWQPVASALFGLIPGCAPSVIIAQLYVSGTLSLGGALAGLISATGVGLAVLFKSRGAKEGLMMALALAALGAASGLIADLIA